MPTVGKIHKNAKVIEWKLRDYFSLPNKEAKWYISPSFKFAGAFWYLQIFPNGEPEKDSVGYIGLYLVKYSSYPVIKLDWSVGLKTIKGSRYNEKKSTHVFKKKESGYGYSNFISRLEVSTERLRLTILDTIIIFCDIQKYSKLPDDPDNHLESVHPGTRKQNEQRLGSSLYLEHRIGNLHTATKVFEWRVQNFLALTKEEEKGYRSPIFRFNRNSWYLVIYPNGRRKKRSVGHIGIYLHRVNIGSPYRLTWSFILKTVNGEKVREVQNDDTFAEKGYGHKKFLEVTTLSEARSWLLPNDTLTINCVLQTYRPSDFKEYLKNFQDEEALSSDDTSSSEDTRIRSDSSSSEDTHIRSDTSSCEESDSSECEFSSKFKGTSKKKNITAKAEGKPLKFSVNYTEKPSAPPLELIDREHRYESTSFQAGKSSTSKCPNCKDIVETKDLSTHEKKCVNKPIKCPECFDIVVLKDWLEHKCQLERSTGAVGTQDAESEIKCIICMEGQRNVLLIPCRHLILCTECERRIKRICPVCQVPVETTMKVFT